MKVGRNDPCPCGSGKKYKKCCLGKDEAAGRQAASAQAEAMRAMGELDDDLPDDAALLDLDAITDPDLRAELETLDPPNAAADALWAEFEEAEPDAIPALFRRGLAERALDDDLAFEMLTELRGAGADAEAWALLAELRAAWPELYQASENYYLQWQIADAVDTGHDELLPELTSALAQWADADLDTFSIERDRLAYHGHLALVADMMQQAWPLVRDAEAGLFGNDIRFVGEGQQFTFLAYLERTPAPRADDPALLSALEHFAPVEPEQLADLFAQLTGGAASGEQPTGQLDDVQLTRLSLRFLGDLRRSAGVSLARGELARVALVRYIDDRRQGRLGKVARPPKVKGKPQPAGAAATTNLLCPDQATFDRFLGELLNPIAPAFYQAVATLELTPAWLRFLQAQKLITAEQRAAALHDLRRLVADVAPIWEQRGADPAVGANIKAAWGRDEVPDAA